MKVAGIAMAALVACAGCRPMSEHVAEPSAGLNGGFEHARGGLPVNWLVYSPQTIPSGSYELVFDTADFQEGRQSLCFRVRECSADGGWRSPGITNEYPAEPGDYTLAFWIKSEGCRWRVSFGGVTAKTGDYVRVDSDTVPGGSWQRVELPYSLGPAYDRLRVELSITSPGSLWIDGLTIEPPVEPSG